MNNVYVSSFIAFIVGITVSAFLILSNVDCAEKADLENLVKAVLSKDLDDRRIFIETTEHFKNVEQVPSLSSDDTNYYVFDISESGKSALGLTKLQIGSSNYFGLYIVLTNSGVVKDFGYHKP
jgi:hypothetical protein